MKEKAVVFEPCLRPEDIAELVNTHRPGVLKEFRVYPRFTSWDGPLEITFFAHDIDRYDDNGTCVTQFFLVAGGSRYLVGELRGFYKIVVGIAEQGS